MSDTSGIDPSSDGIDTSGGGGIGDFFSNIGSGLSNMFSGGSGSLSDMASQLFGGGGGGQDAATQTNTTSADQSFLDPSTAAQTAISGGQNAPQNTQSQNPQGQQGQGSQNQNQTPQTAIDALKKALTNLRQQQRQNPYQTGGGGPNTGAGSSMLNRAARIPTGSIPPMPAQVVPPNLFDDSQGSQEANLPSQFASAMEFSNDNAAPPQSGIDPADAVRAGLRTNAPDTGFRIPGQPANENTPPSTFQDYLNNMRARVTQPAPPIEGLNAPSGAGTPPPGDMGLGGLAGIARMMGLGPAAIGAAAAMKPTPAETGELTPGQLGMNYRPEDDIENPNLKKWVDAKGQPATNIPIGGGEGNKMEAPTGKAITRAPATGKPVKTVNPKTGKEVDAKTGDPLPTHKGHYEPATGDARDKTWHSGHGQMMRDVAGMQGVPQMLGQLAQMALPLLMSSMMGGMGGGGRGRHGFGGFRGGRFGGHFGGHPGFGGRPGFGGHPGFGFGGHPGFGGFRRGGPMGPTRGFMNNPLGYTGANQGGGGTGNPELDQLLQSLGLGGFTSGDTGVSNKGMQYGPGNHFNQGGNWGFSAPATQGPWSQNPVLNTLVGAESSGYNSGAPGQGPGGDGGIARGYYNIQTPTWREFAPGVPGASQYATADQAPPEIQTAVAMSIPVSRFGDRTRAILHRQFGDFNERLTVGELAGQHGQMPEVASSGKPGTTKTGGSTNPNPQGNPADVDTTPSYTQMGPENNVAAQ